MHKLTAALLAAFGAAHRFASSVAVRIHALLIDLHVANLRAMVQRAEARAKRLVDMAVFHRAAAVEADTLADEAGRVADATALAAQAEAAKHGVTVTL